MSESRGLLDTSAVIRLGTLPDASALPDDCVISAITLAELSVGPLVATDSAERAARQRHLQQAEADFETIPFDAAAARAFGGVAASLRSSGRKPAARAYDALIAATAIANGLPVYTFNPGDFAGIEGLELRELPGLDSNQEPIGYPLRLVTSILDKLPRERPKTTRDARITPLFSA